MLKENSIPYLPANAGHFVWVDLSANLHQFEGSTAIEQERSLNSRFLKGGLHLGTSETFLGEEPGWFRLTFTVGRHVWEVGLNRYWI
jgi:hypothetical protein